MDQGELKMALSNWNTMAWDEKGKFSDRLFNGKDCSVQIYKNWAYLRDIKGWSKESNFIKPTIAHITHYTDKHPKSGKTEFTFKGKKYEVD